MPTATQQPQGFQQYSGFAPAPQPPAQQLAGPGEIVQSVELQASRWKKELGLMKVSVIQLLALTGTSFPADPEAENDGAFPIADLMRNDDGTCDMDFEESAIELLGKIILAGTELVETASRFRYNLQIRPHEDVPPEETDENEDETPPQA